MVRFVKSFLRDDSGAAAAEYALILAVIGVAIAAAAVVLGNAVETAITRAGTAINTANAGA